MALTHPKHASKAVAVDRPAAAETSTRGRARDVRRASLWSARRRSEVVGQALTWLCGGALAFNLLLVIAILLLLLYNGMGYFWQRDLVQLELKDGRKVLGEIWEVEQAAAVTGAEATAAIDRIRMKIGNRDVEGLDFAWIDSKDIARRTLPQGAVMLERLEWGNFYGFLGELRQNGAVIARGPEAVWKAFQPLHEKKVALREEIRDLEKGAIGDINYEIESLRLDRRKLELERDLPAAERMRRSEEIDRELGRREAEYQRLAERLFTMREELLAETLVLRTAGGETKEMPVGAIVHALQPNRMGLLDKLGLYLSRIWEFIADDPRESNTEGGIFPAIFGTVMMVFIMSFAVAPLGVLAALYLREYARQGPLVRMVRIAVNNLAGVPSIVFGVFGLGFFVYLIGGSIDRLFYPESLPAPTFGTGGILWASLTLALLTVPVVIVAAEEGLAAVPRIVREGSLALGATKFETIRRVVLPAAAPGILTGMILAMARAAGEVAPLMIVGMVKLAPALPVDGNPPFVHLERKFMHLGFHIYDVGFQSPNVEATTPLVFATALLLIVVVTVMNLVAIALRNHLRRKYAGSAV
ncbi:MAG TPA: phosphate ABC transporter permease PstA [Thermoanaerobaculia bacterium]|nr:phosphate ABC transporter permease PstA [Thermoanaerobaculia bacterium]